MAAEQATQARRAERIERITVPLTPGDVQRLRSLAERERRSMAAQARFIVEAALEAAENDDERVAA